MIITTDLSNGGSQLASQYGPTLIWPQHYSKQYWEISKRPQLPYFDICVIYHSQTPPEALGQDYTNLMIFTSGVSPPSKISLDQKRATLSVSKLSTMLYKGEEIATWGDPNKAAGYFGTDERFKDTQVGNFDTIPIINVSGIFSTQLEERKKVAAQIRDACIRVGFFYAEGHGVSQDLVDSTFEVAKKFFGLSFDEKMELFINNQKNYRGYTPVHGSGTPDPLDGKANVNEAFDFGLDSKLNDDPSYTCSDPYMKGSNVWPRQLPEFEVTLSTYFKQLRELGRALTKNVSLSLGLEEDRFDQYLTHPGCSGVVAHYPPQEANSTKLGLDPHTDNEFFTLLAQGEVRALEVLNREGQWISAPPKRGTFVVNVGDQLQRFTNNLYVSTKHRVLNYSGLERYSVPFFFSANWEVVVEPLKELLEDGTIIVPRNVTAGQMYKHTMMGLHMVAESNPDMVKYLKAS